MTGLGLLVPELLLEELLLEQYEPAHNWVAGRCSCNWGSLA